MSLAADPLVGCRRSGSTVLESKISITEFFSVNIRAKQLETALSCGIQGSLDNRVSAIMLYAHAWWRATFQVNCSITNNLLDGYDKTRDRIVTDL
jgi:hypothetical protein